MITLRLGTLPPEIRHSIEQARQGSAWDAPVLSYMVEKHFRDLGPFASVRVVSGPQPEYPEVDSGEWLLLDVDEAAQKLRRDQTALLADLMRAEDVRLAARSPDEVEREEREAIERAAERAEQEQWSEERQRRLDADPVRQLLRRLAPSPYTWFVVEPDAIYFYTLSALQAEAVLEAAGVMRATAMPRLWSIRRRRFGLGVICTTVCLLTFVAVGRPIPRSIPPVVDVGVAGLIAYFATIGCRRVFKSDPSPFAVADSELVDPTTGIDIFAIDRALAAIQERLARGIAVRREWERQGAVGHFNLSTVDRIRLQLEGNEFPHMRRDS
jgi:hypothetical protein